MKLRYKIWLLPLWLKWLIPKGYSAAAFWPLVIIREQKYAIPHIILHEQIHLKQQFELGILFFYLLYFGEYFVYRLKGLKHNEAYMSISFEKEAYRFEKEENYLIRRKPWAQWRKFTMNTA